MLGDPRIELFGSLHLTVTFALCLMGYVIVKLPTSFPNALSPARVAAALAIFMSSQEVVERTHRLIVHGAAFLDVVPLHLCHLTVYLTAITLLTRNAKLFNVVYFWGIPAAGMSILTPDNEYAYMSFAWVNYWTSHAFILIGIAFSIVHFGLRPKMRQLLPAWYWINAYMVPVAVFNYLTGMNYLYICRKPEHATIMDYLGPWPWYVVALELVALSLFALAYLPWGVKDFRAGKIGSRFGVGSLQEGQNENG